MFGEGFTFSGQDPDSTLSINEKSINVAGLKWFLKDDYLVFNSEAINFAQKVMGRKLENKIGLPGNLTMRDCLSLVAQVFDPTGRLTPIIAGFNPCGWPMRRFLFLFFLYLESQYL